MGRLVVLLLIVVLVVWLLRRALRGPADGPPPAAGGGPGAASQGELVSCAHCGVNLPRSEARAAGGRHYCSEEHWRAGPRDG
jgi:uncharacterized protein